MAGRATWTLTVRRRSVDTAGTARLEAELTDRGTKAGDLILTMTAERELRVEWQAASGAEPLRNFEAWAKAAD